MRRVDGWLSHGQIGHLGACTFGQVDLMCAIAPRSCWELMSGYDMSVLQGAMGFGASSAYGVIAAQRATVAHLIGA